MNQKFTTQLCCKVCIYTHAPSKVKIYDMTNQMSCNAWDIRGVSTHWVSANINKEIDIYQVFSERKSHKNQESL